MWISRCSNGNEFIAVTQSWGTGFLELIKARAALIDAYNNKFALTTEIGYKHDAWTVMQRNLLLAEIYRIFKELSKLEPEVIARRVEIQRKRYQLKNVYSDITIAANVVGAPVTDLIEAIISKTTVNDYYIRMAG